MSQRNLLILLLATGISYACYVRGEQNPYARYIADGLTAIEKGSLEPVPDRELFDAAMRAMVDALRRRGDEHSQFLTEQEAEPLRSEIRQQFGGIGVRIGFEGDPPRLVIVGPPDPGTPSARANLLPGDEILYIDGNPTSGLAMSEVLRLMRGQPGTKVRLLVQQNHAPQPRMVELVREVIQLESILGDRRNDQGAWEFRLADEPRIAHIRIASFGERTANELAMVLEKARDDGVAGIVLDLRDNAGGALDAATDVCELLLPSDKLIVEVRGRDRQLRRRYVTKADGPYSNLPLAVVVNRNSASAAEIVAACLQDHGQAIIVGERTYGKGTVQQLVPLESGRSLLKLTWASFWRPNGQQIHHDAGSRDDETWGVMPDAAFVRPFSAEQYAAYRKHRSNRDSYRSRPPGKSSAGANGTMEAEFADTQLEAATNYLRRKIDKQHGGESRSNADPL